jgi:hypothetical protein
MKFHTRIHRWLIRRLGIAFAVAAVIAPAAQASSAGLDPASLPCAPTCAFETGSGLDPASLPCAPTCAFEPATRATSVVIPDDRATHGPGIAPAVSTSSERGVTMADRVRGFAHERGTTAQSDIELAWPETLAGAGIGIAIALALTGLALARTRRRLELTPA